MTDTPPVTMDDSLKDAFITKSNSASPVHTKYSAKPGASYGQAGPLTGSAINGMHIGPKYKELTWTTNRCTKRIFNVCDTFLSLLVITPLAVAHWRGTWALMDLYEEYFTPWTCFVIGGILHTVFALLREYLHTEFSRPSEGIKSWRRTVLRHIVTRLYTYVFSVGSIMHWRGGWAVLTEYFGN